MAYLPKHKQKINIKPAGSILLDSQNREMKGDFTQDFQGNFYKGIGVSSTSEPLTLITLEPQSGTSLYSNNFTSTTIPPTESDYLNKKYTRYFIKDQVLKKVIETDKDSYTKELDSKKLYRTLLKLEWLIKGPPDDIVIKGYPYKGIGSRNQETIDKANAILIGIKDQVLKDPKQFVKM